jgi:hypothetical protein
MRGLHEPRVRAIRGNLDQSPLETEYRLELAHDFGVLATPDWTSLTSETVEIRRMLCAFRRRLLADPK